MGYGARFVGRRGSTKVSTRRFTRGARVAAASTERLEGRVLLASQTISTPGAPLREVVVYESGAFQFRTDQVFEAQAGDGHVSQVGDDDPLSGVFVRIADGTLNGKVYGNPLVVSGAVSGNQVTLSDGKVCTAQCFDTFVPGAIIGMTAIAGPGFVFDGWQGGMGAEGHEHRAGVGVIYTKRGERADQVIQRLAVEYGRGCAVVSSDREVGHTASAHGAFLIAAGEFASRLSESGRRHTGPPERGIKDEDADPRRTRDPKKKGNPRKLPKAQRRRNQQLRRF